MAAYLRRLAGYALVGLANEKQFFFAHGPKDTSKSSFVRALAATLGDYHVSTTFDTWLVHSQVGGNRGDLVRLAGARLVSAVEVREHAKFDTELLKKVTGGDPITAAAKYEGEVTFDATFKLLFAANDAPKVRDDDEPLWGRLRLLPFTHRIASPDPKVVARLCDTADTGPAILAWAVRGCIEWQLRGMGQAPAAVTTAGAALRDAMDPTNEFLEEQCQFVPEGRVARRLLRAAYDQFARERNIHGRLSARELAAKLRARGVTDGGTVRVLCGQPEDAWRGVRLCRDLAEPI
jgi:putative DNA primase/helicase